MENKLQQLTQKLYDEGLEKGRSEADALVAKAKSEAEEIVKKAKAEAQEIVKKAKSEAEDSLKNSLTEISLAGKQALAKIKAEISGAIINGAIASGVKDATMDAAFIKEILISVAKNWDGASSSKIELQALLPEANQKSLDVAFAKSTKELLAAGVEVGYSKDVKSGFKVGAKDGGYYISFSDEDFDALMRGYLREKVSELLFKA
ncbi:MAG: hypothetical protein SNG27_04575 [Rikenellaceae bacterium]